MEVGREVTAEVRTNDLVDRLEYEEQRECDSREDERSGQRHATSDRADQPADRDRDHRSQGASQQKQRPPGERMTGRRGPKRLDKRPFLPLAKLDQHGRHPLTSDYGQLSSKPMRSCTSPRSG